MTGYETEVEVYFLNLLKIVVYIAVFIYLLYMSVDCKWVYVSKSGTVGFCLQQCLSRPGHQISQLPRNRPYSLVQLAHEFKNCVLRRLKISPSIFPERYLTMIKKIHRRNK